MTASTKSPDDDLRALAERADQGEWFAQMDSAKVIATEPGSSFIGDQRVIALCATGDLAYRNAAFIAAFNPQTAIALLNERDALRERLAEAERERDAYQTACLAAGVCMTCVIRAPEPYGCTDCLNTGWDGGAPAGFVSEAVFADQKTRGDHLEESLRWYANPEIYKPHPHGPAFDDRDLSWHARTALAQSERTP